MMVFISNPYRRRKCTMFSQFWLRKCSLHFPLLLSFLFSHKSKSLDLFSSYCAQALFKGFTCIRYEVDAVNATSSVRKPHLGSQVTWPCLSHWGAQLGMQTRALCFQGLPVELSLLPCVSALGADSVPLHFEFFECQGYVFLNFASSLW